MANGKGRPPHNKRFQGGARDDVVLEKIKKISSFSELEPQEYALPEGFAENIARNERDMKTAQLRKFFTKIKNLEKKISAKKDNEELGKEIKNEIYLIIPELAYSRGRGLIKMSFFNIISTSIKEKINTVGDLRNFSKFVTAIVAYKKAHGG